MQALIDFIIRNLLALWPIARVYSWQQGLRVRGGCAREELAPGLHWRWWFFDEVKTWPTTEQAIDLATASITTTDGISVSVSANVSYRLVSLRTMWLALWNTDTALKLLALGAIASSCAAKPWDSLASDRAALEADLLRVLNARARVWGVQFLRIHLTDMVRTRGLRHYVDGMGKGE